jgi:hypothetical protein
VGVEVKLDDNVLVNIMRNEKVKNAKDPTKRSEHEIIKGFQLKEQQMDIVEEWSSREELKTRWRNVVL